MLNETYRAMLATRASSARLSCTANSAPPRSAMRTCSTTRWATPASLPGQFTNAMQTLLAEEEPVALHGYCPSQGDPGFRTAVAAHLQQTFGLPYAQKDIFPHHRCGGRYRPRHPRCDTARRRGADLRPLLPRVRPLCGGHRRLCSRSCRLRLRLSSLIWTPLKQMLTENVTCVLINTPNNPTGVVYSADTLTRLADILTEKSKAFGHNIFLVSDEPYRDIAFDGKGCALPGSVLPPHPDLLLLLQEPEPARRAPGLCGRPARLRGRGGAGGHDGPDLPLHRPQLPAQHHPARTCRVPRCHQRSVRLRDEHEPAVR